MLIEEAKWFNQEIQSMDDSIVFPMLNVGSSTDKFRKNKQPWIDEYIFNPARKKNQLIQHLDVKQAPGVDIVGNLIDPNFLRRLSKMKFKSVFCTNLLEHVVNKEEIGRILVSIIPAGGYLFVSCPFKYPRHPDPIDTMFRPGIQELASLFPYTDVVSGEIVATRVTYSKYITRSPLVLTKTIIRIFLPFYKPKSWFIAVNKLRWLFRRFQVTCIVLRKNFEKI